MTGEHIQGLQHQTCITPSDSKLAIVGCIPWGGREVYPGQEILKFFRIRSQSVVVVEMHPVVIAKLEEMEDVAWWSFQKVLELDGI